MAPTASQARTTIFNDFTFTPPPNPNALQIEAKPIPNPIAKYNNSKSILKGVVKVKPH